MKVDSIPRPLRYLIEIALLSLVIFLLSWGDDMLGFRSFTITPLHILIPVFIAVYGWVAMYCFRDKYNVENQYKWLVVVSQVFAGLGIVGFIILMYGGFILMWF